MTEKTEDEAVDMQEMMTAASEGEVETEEPEETAAVEQSEPDDNKERSKLGRKVEALWARIDEQKGTLSKVAEVLESMAAEKEKVQDDGTLITATEARKIAEERFEELLKKKTEAESTAKTQYERQYLSEVTEIGKGLDPDEFDAIDKIMMDKFNIKHSDNPRYDAIRNFKDAQIEYLRQGKTLKRGKVPDGAKIATTGSEKVNKKDNPLPKLDAAAERYLSFVRNSRGDDAAKSLHKSI